MIGDKPKRKYIKLCHVCNLPPDVEQALTVDYIKGFTLTALGEKYFPTNNIHSAIRKISVHYRKHNPVKMIQNAQAVAVVGEIFQPSNEDMPPAYPATEHRVFSDSFSTRINATMTLEQLMRLLMGKINFIEDEWVRVHNGTKCKECGRDDNGANIAKMLSCIRELRELNGQWIKIKNPMAVVRDFFGKTFTRFVQEMNYVYREALNSRSKAVRDAINMFIENKINHNVLSTRVKETEDLGIDNLKEEASDKLKQILGETLREMESNSF